MSEDIFKLAKQLSDDYNAELKENNPQAGPWKHAMFVCPDCATQIVIRTNLEFIHPFRIACPCKYSAMHRGSLWQTEGYGQ
jgi:hypothetical protein